MFCNYFDINTRIVRSSLHYQSNFFLSKKGFTKYNPLKNILLAVI